MKKYLMLSLLVQVFSTLSLAQYNPIERANIRDSGTQAVGSSYGHGISTDTTGRYIVFDSDAANLVSGDDNSVTDIFLRDLQTDTTIRVTNNANDGDSTFPAISADGNLIVFQSTASDLVSGDSNDASDIFLYNQTTLVTTLISDDASGNDSNGDSIETAISDDGSYLAFTSAATDIVASDSNGFTDIFLHNITGGTTILISRDSSGNDSNGISSTPALSSDGSYVAYESNAHDLVAGDSNDSDYDIFLYNRNTMITSRVSNTSAAANPNGNAANPVISNDGRYIAYASTATNITTVTANSNVFVYDTMTGTTTLVSKSSTGTPGDNNSYFPSIDSSGRYVAFVSDATNLASGDNNEVADIYVHDLDTSKTVLASVSSVNKRGNGLSTYPTLNGDAHYLAFSSDASNFVSGDTNGFTDIFVINQQCTVKPTGVVPEDQDSDGTDDCSDQCPKNSTKIEPGTCGCEKNDVDTDGDGIFDCEDECPDIGDDNGNGVQDCKDVTTDTKPAAPRVFVKEINGVTKIILVVNAGNAAGTKYFGKIFRAGTVLASKVSDKRKIFFNASELGNFTANDKFVARYALSVPGTNPIQYTKNSKKWDFYID